METMLDTKAVAEALGVKPRTIQHWVQHGKFPAPVKYHGNSFVRWHQGEVQDWLKQQPRGGR